MPTPKVGLLPLYIALYDEALPAVRKRMDTFYATITNELRDRGLEALTAPVCRLKKEFAAAVASFEKGRADAIVTLHLAYSPSLESADALAGTHLPIVVLDTTPGYAFGPTTDPAEIMYNHGIHGVQDMCNLLIRNGKPFQIEAGHWKESDVLDRVAAWARAARLATSIRTARVGRVGPPFKGMGDFSVPPDVLRSTIGIQTIPLTPKMLPALLPAENSKAVKAEMVDDLARFEAVGVKAENHRQTVRAGLAIRRWVEKEALTAFTINFLAADRKSGLPTMPFMEACKAMSRGIGYAGEGDVLTAALVGALAASYPEATFTEMFCPDWKGGSIFLSHMGEFNIALAAQKPVLRQKPFPWTDVLAEPTVVVGRLRSGGAVMVNLAPGADHSYSLVVAPGQMVSIDEDAMSASVRGWFRPAMPVADFLAAYSRAGGTHHSALVYGDVASDICRFGAIMGWNVVVLDRK